MKIFIGWRLFAISLLLAVPFFSWAITRIVRSNNFDDNCTYHITQALGNYSITTPPEKGFAYSEQEIDTAITYLEKNNLTNGYTTITDRQSFEDLSAYYSSLKERSEYLHSLKNMRSEEVAAFQKYTTMKNLQSKEVDCPNGISVFPHNTLYMIWMLLSMLCLIGSIIGVITFIDERTSITN